MRGMTGKLQTTWSSRDRDDEGRLVIRWWPYADSQASETKQLSMSVKVTASSRPAAPACPGPVHRSAPGPRCECPAVAPGTRHSAHRAPREKGRTAGAPERWLYSPFYPLRLDRSRVHDRHHDDQVIKCPRIGPVMAISVTHTRLCELQDIAAGYEAAPRPANHDSNR